MSACCCALLLALLVQEGVLAQRAAPRGAPVAETAPEAPAAPESAPALALEGLLDHPEAHLPAIVALEAEVAALYQTLEGLVSAEEGGAARLLDAAPAGDVSLQDIGVSDRRAAQIEVLADEVSALRAKLRLLELRAPSLNDPNEGLRDIAEVVASASAEAEPPPDAEPAPGAAAASAAGAPAAPPAPGQPCDPSREALLAFKQGDLDGVIRILAGREPHDLAPEALYVLGCALIEKRDFAGARLSLLRVQETGERRALSESARRQIERMDRLQSGAVGARPQAREAAQ